MSSFIHFGCWNDGLCNIETGNNALSKVMSALKNESPPSFYIVAGDNYYPKKDQDKKMVKSRTFIKEHFDSGFECLKTVRGDIPMYLLMGNHDLKYEKNLISSDTTEKAFDKCHIIENEMKQEFDTQSYAHLMSEHTICLFINTVLYTDDRENSIECISTYRSMNLESIKQYQKVDETILTEILTTVARFHKINNIIVVGHDPIVTRRFKKKRDVRKPLDDDGLRFLDKLYNIVPSANKYYLCADTHNYQVATIKLKTHTIQQYVVGTGGTDLDEEDISTTDPLVKIELADKTIDLQHQLTQIDLSHGYLLCNEESDDTLKFTFKSIDSPTKKKGTKKMKKKGKSRKTRKVTSRSISL
jgi:predicted MPP superfamily phosphohydrolase